MHKRHDASMPHRPFALAALGVALSLGVAACGGGGAEPATADEAAADGEGAGDGEAAGGEGATDAEGADAPAAEPEEPEPPKLTPKDILLKEGTLFLVDFAKSDIGIKIDEKCEAKAKGDVAKKAKCVSAEFDKIPREGITFDEDDAGNWWYIRFGIMKNNVQVIWNKVQVEVGEPSGDKLTLKPTGKDVARARKGTVPGELNFEVPDEYTVVLMDPARGRLEFEPKLGLLEAEGGAAQ